MSTTLRELLVAERESEASFLLDLKLSENLDKEELTKSSEFITLEPATIVDNSFEESEPSYSSVKEVLKTAEESPFSSDLKCKKLSKISSDLKIELVTLTDLIKEPSATLEKVIAKSVEKCEAEGEATVSEESAVITSREVVGGRTTEKDEATVSVQINECVSDNAKSTALTLKQCPSVGVKLDVSDLNIFQRLNGGGLLLSPESCTMVDEAWERLSKSYVYFKGKPVGTLAAMDTSADALNYNQHLTRKFQKIFASLKSAYLEYFAELLKFQKDRKFDLCIVYYMYQLDSLKTPQVFVRDFVPSGLACLMKEPPEPEIVRNFLLKTLHLQGLEKRVDNFTLGEGVLPASFKVLYDSDQEKETLLVDFGASAIGRVAPVDSGFWWIILLRSYIKRTRDYALLDRPEVQKGMKLILKLCLSDGFDTFPTLLCADGCSMIDRRMGIYGYPIEIQALFYFALRCAKQMLKPERDGKEFIERIEKRIAALSYHIQTYYWLDFTQLNNIYRYKTEEYSHTAVNKFNVIPESIPDWVFDFMPLRGGYLIGNVSPARMDFRWFLVGNCIAILSSLVTPAQATAIMDLVEERWEDLIGEMPLKITYPALEGHEWRAVTGFDPKNTRWSYHNGGSWPVLLWLLSAACIKVGRPQIAKRAIELAEQRLSKDGWPEYYDGKTGRYVGKQARKYQTWSIAGYLVAKMMVENPSNLLLISLEEDKKIAKSRIVRSNSSSF
ncbi:ALKALINE/NEUTRAL INVERTASE F-RELATED [Salix koriyanagi]|uniref:Alkaline/neutral invertase n=1 Tax=Salix koriyanagi TaxID=2511006 RepID=A0A9Q0TER4_9ROSI|nr:ALKALINE/NEUTRAL INVERTASE F-RELATED [Salix koriyanagi]